MGLIEEVQNLKASGTPENQIEDILEKRGYAVKDILNAMSQSKIRDAVSADSSSQQYQQDMQPSMLDSKAPQQEGYDQQQQAYYQPQQGYDYNTYSPTSTDAISEIAEQIASEKLSSVKEQLEKVVDMRNTFETKITYIDSRLKRIEAIIDKLQMSILEKVGDYASNIQDIKKELIETQKSFKAMSK